MTKQSIAYPLRIADLPKASRKKFEVNFNDNDVLVVAETLSAVSVRKMRITGELEPLGKNDWHLSAKVGATVTQSCVVSNDPVQTRVDVPVSITYVSGYNFGQDDDTDENELDDTTEPLPTEINLADIAIEAVALAIPDYPRADNVELEQQVFSEPGTKAMTDEDAKPFASLAGLKDKLAKDQK